MNACLVGKLQTGLVYIVHKLNELSFIQYIPWLLRDIILSPESFLYMSFRS